MISEKDNSTLEMKRNEVFEDILSIPTHPSLVISDNNGHHVEVLFQDGKLVYSGNIPVDESAKAFFQSMNSLWLVEREKYEFQLEKFKQLIRGKIVKVSLESKVVGDPKKLLGKVVAGYTVDFEAGSIHFEFERESDLVSSLNHRVETLQMEVDRLNRIINSR